MMNSFFVTEQARHLVNKIPDRNKTSNSERIKALYHAIFQRDPADKELEIGINFVRSSSEKTDEKNLGPWQRYAQLLLCTNEFEFID